MTEANQESRLSRWSRRKQQTVEDTRKEDLAFDMEQQSQVENELEEVLSEDQQQVETLEPVLSDADMAPIESLTENSDFSKFMSSGVSDELRNLALRKMFKAPFFNIRDGLDEYDEDYTTFEKLGDIVTADMRHQMEIESERKLEAEANAINEAESAESESIIEEEEADMIEDQTSSIAAEDESLELAEEDASDDLAPDSSEISNQSVEKTQQN
jgi:hypothetical protein